MTDADEVKAFSGYHVQDKSKENPSQKGMHVVHAGIGDISKGNGIELGITTSTVLMQGHQNGPGDAASDEAYDAYDLQVAQEKEGIERVAMQESRVGHLVEGLHPVEPSIG